MGDRIRCDETETGDALDEGHIEQLRASWPPVRWRCVFSAAQAQEKPNVVLVFMDNFGWGEPGFNGGGIIRGAPTPRIDQLAAEGLRLTNFNVESQCTPSRAAIMTGRYAIRTGNGTIPLGGGVYGLVQWEYHDGRDAFRRRLCHRHVRQSGTSVTPRADFPTDQGFDEWYGIPNSSDETPWEVLDGYAESGVEGTYIYEGTKGSAPKQVNGLTTSKERALIDLELTKRAIKFMKRQVEEGQAVLPVRAVHA